MNKLTKILNYPIRICSWILAISLLLSYISIYVSPKYFWILALFGLAYQLLLVLNIIMLIILFYTSEKRMFVQIFALVPSLFFIPSFFQISNTPPSEIKGDTLKIASYNVQMFQLPFKQQDSSYFKIAAFLNSKELDIICLQEFYLEEGKLDLEDFSKLLKNMKYKYAYCRNINKKSKGKGGVAIFSKHPIKMQLEIPFEETYNSALYADIEVNNKTIRIYNVHLQSVKLNINKSIARIIGNQKEQRFEEVNDVSNRLKKAFVKRAQQVEDLSKHIRVSPYPVILCGDFNDTPVSYTYNKLKGNMKDAFRESGRGLPSTYRGSIPSLRIDYTLFDKNFVSIYHKVLAIDYSDHYPIVSKLIVKE